jgi:hypothetical protein
MKKLIVLLLFSLNALAVESYGIGKIVKVDKKNSLGFGKIQHFLVIKHGNQLGALPIITNKKFSQKDLDKTKDKVVIFRGRIKSKKFKFKERVETVEVIDFAKMKELSFNDLNIAFQKVNEKKPDYDLEKKNYAPKNIALNDSTAQTAILTSAALLLNDFQASEGPQGKLRRDLTAGVILTSGIIMLADKLKKSIKIDGNWSMNPQNKEDPENLKKLDVTQ